MNNQVVKTGDAVSGHEVAAITENSVSLREPRRPTRTLQLPELGAAPAGGAEEVSVTMRFRTQMLRALSGLALVLLLPGGPAAAQPQDACASRLPAERVTLNLRDASVQTALRLLAQQYKVNMLVTEEVRGHGDARLLPGARARRLPGHHGAANLRCVASRRRAARQHEDPAPTEEDDRGSRRGRAILRLEADTRKKISRPGAPRRSSAELAARGPIREETIRLQLRGRRGGRQDAPGHSRHRPQVSTKAGAAAPALPALCPEPARQHPLLAAATADGALPFAGGACPRSSPRGSPPVRTRPTNSLLIR